MKTIDLRSDTVTRPSQEMRRVMANAEVGDDVFNDDPSVIALQEYVADLFEVEAALYVPSGTMSNQVCLRAHSQPGWELLCDRQCHIVNYEQAGPAVHSGLLVNLLTTHHGMVTADMVRECIRPRNLHTPITKMVALENTHNHHGGTILPQDQILKVREACDEFDLIFHLDGARVWNAHVATGMSLAELVRPFHSVSVCLSKGLGAPVGSLALGTRDFIDQCLRERKLFGGGMRQAGIIAAAGLYAVKHNIERLTEDHDNARYLAQRLNDMPLFTVDMDRVQTNIVLADITTQESAVSLLERLQSVGVLGVPFGPQQIRFVTHLDVTRDDIDNALTQIERLS